MLNKNTEIVSFFPYLVVLFPCIVVICLGGILSVASLAEAHDIYYHERWPIGAYAMYLFKIYEKNEKEWWQGDVRKAGILFFSSEVKILNCNNLMRICTQLGN